MLTVQKFISKKTKQIVFSYVLSVFVLLLLMILPFLGWYRGKEVERLISNLSNDICQSVKLGDHYRLQKLVSSVGNNLFTEFIILSSSNIVISGAAATEQKSLYSFDFDFEQPVYIQGSLCAFTKGSYEVKMLEILFLVSGFGAIFVTSSFFLNLALKRQGNSVGQPLQYLNEIIAIPFDQRSTIVDNEKFKYSEVMNIYMSHLDQEKRNLAHQNQLIQLEKAQTIAQTTQMLAHDLKGPLGVFQKVAYGNTDDFLRTKENLKSALVRLHSMANSIKQADLESMVRPFRVCFEMTDTIDQCRLKANQHCIKFEVDGPTLTNITVDLQKVERSVMNLVFNAIEAAYRYVHLTWELSDDDLTIRVMDDGPGIADEIGIQIFESGMTYGKQQGTGLGLAFVKHTAMGHGGTIRYYRDKKLTVFELVLKNVSFLQETGQRADLKKQGSKRRMIFIKTVDMELDANAISEIESRLGVPVTSRFSDIEACQLAYTDDVDLFSNDLATSGIPVIFAAAPENLETIIDKIVKRIG